MDDVLTAPVGAPPVGLASGPLGAVKTAWREVSRQTALQARAVAAFAVSRPASADRAPGEPGAMSAERWASRSEVLRAVSEWAAQELTVALSISEQAAEALLERSLTLVHRLPATLDALEAGLLHPGLLGCLLDKVAPIADDGLRAEVERVLLTWVAARGVTTPAQLSDEARREVLRRNARNAADELARAVRRRGIEVRPDRVDGMSVLTALLTTPEARALIQALGAYADALPRDGRTRGQRMADCLLDLVLRPGESALPPVQVTLTVLAPAGALLGGDAPCEIDGQLVPAEMVRALLAALSGGQVTLTDRAAGAPCADGTATNASSANDPAVDETAADPIVADEAAADEAASAELRALLAEQEDLARWSAQFEDRILAGEFDDEPCDDRPPEGCCGPPTDDRDDGDQPASDSSEPALTPAAPAGDVSEGWWVRADRAVDDAGTAVLAAQQALGRARRVVRTAEAAAAADEAAFQASAGGRVSTAPDALSALRAATDEARDTLAALLGATGGGGLTDRPRIALTSAVSGALLCLTDLPAMRRTGTCGAPACRRRPETCDHDLTGRPGLGTPGPTDGYRPAAALDRHVRARDRRCRFPGCRRPVPHGGELDHLIAWPHGDTCAANLVGFCTRHHRGKHQAPGWTHELAPDGTLTVTTPTGLTAGTSPPPC
ncbi:hypothetical protein JOD57_004405 [Geodermatophilus bullaregiensis]|uniref:HNH endonuclease signature motif containing protein n=1 Tax=Geodermatophilus bullaregiensis TaxID=1564160 RepID=UPI0027DB3497|nr:DUF222 domain-containing protein [Geodermatophilus bullaregiensis]MBM7808568.1 hypothetical protein [Geodermatophilus bullaregiensis]